MTLLQASAMPLLAHNIAANEALFRSASTHPHALVLRWDDEQLPNGVSAINGRCHLQHILSLPHPHSLSPHRCALRATRRMQLRDWSRDTIKVAVDFARI